MVWSTHRRTPASRSARRSARQPRPTAATTTPDLSRPQNATQGRSGTSDGKENDHGFLETMAAVLPDNGRSNFDSTPMQLHMPDLPEDDLLIDTPTWEAREGWHGPEEAQQAAANALRDAKSRALQTQSRIVADLRLSQKVSKLPNAPCRFCGVATETVRMSLGSAWRSCESCWSLTGVEEAERRLAFARKLIPGLPPDIVPNDLRGTVFAYFEEIGHGPTDRACVPWSWIKLDTLAAQIADNHDFGISLHRAPAEFAQADAAVAAAPFCRSCGAAPPWRSTRPGSEEAPESCRCARTAAQLWVKGRG